jgi:hypothetical protein
MRWWLPLLVAAGCVAKDDRPLQGGGGHGGSGTGASPDASVAQGDGGSEITGTVCVVTDLRSPFACPAVASAQNVVVAEVGGNSTVSDAAGDFTLDTNSSAPLLELGSSPGDGLLTTRFVAQSSPVDAPVIDETTWENALVTLNTTQTTGAMLIYVIDTSGPVSGATVSFAGTAQQGARIYYDDGAGGFDPNAVATGAGGLALVLDVGAAEMRADQGTKTASANVPTVNGGVGVTVLTLL